MLYEFCNYVAILLCFIGYCFMYYKDIAIVITLPSTHL